MCLGGPKLPHELHDLQNMKNQKLISYHQQECVDLSQTARQEKQKNMWQAQKIHLFKPSKECVLVLYGIILFVA